MMSLISSLREWWRWRMHRARIHLPPIAQYRVRGRSCGSKVGVGLSQDEDTRLRHVEANERRAGRAWNLRISRGSPLVLAQALAPLGIKVTVAEPGGIA